jgi:hypothetical protein
VKAALSGRRGTGARRRNSPTLINVKSAPHNATGNDSTNDTAAFASAIAAAGANEVVYVPAGTNSSYRISSLTIPSDTHIWVESGAKIRRSGTTGNGFIVIFEGPDATTMSNNSSIRGVNGRFEFDLSDAQWDTQPVIVRQARNVTIEHVDLIMRNEDPTAVTGSTSILKNAILFLPRGNTQVNGEYMHGTDVYINDCHAYNLSYGWGCVQFSGGERVTIENISANNGGTALMMEPFETNWSPAIDVVANNVSATDGRMAVLFNPHNTQNGTVTITNVTSTSCEYGLKVEDDDAFVDGSFAADSSVSGLTVVSGNNAMRKMAGSFGWTRGASRFCTSIEASLTYTAPALSGVSCGGLPSETP